MCQEHKYYTSYIPDFLNMKFLTLFNNYMHVTVYLRIQVIKQLNKV